MFVGVQGSLEEIEDTAQYSSYKVYKVLLLPSVSLLLSQRCADELLAVLSQSVQLIHKHGDRTASKVVLTRHRYI